MRAGRTAIIALQFLAFVGIGLAVTWPSLAYPWYGDDLHLIRVFSSDELRSVWRATWDVDGLETSGYRPLTVLFNHARASVFGEHVAAHRIFMIALCAWYLVLIGSIGRRFRLTPAATLLAGVMMLCAKYTMYHLVWIADGVHLAQGVLFALAAIAMLRWIESAAWHWWLGALLFYLLSVLVREDSLAIAAVLLALAYVHGRQQADWPAQRRGVRIYSIGIIIISVAALLARQAVAAGDDSSWTALPYLAAHALEVVTLAGWHPYFLIPLFAAIFVWLVAVMRHLAPADARPAGLWLFCAAASMAPAVVESRVNLLLFPVTFYCVFAAQVLSRVMVGQVRDLRRWNRAVAAAVIVCAVALPGYHSRRQQLSMAPRSISRLEAACDIARGGPLASKTPQQRRDGVLAELRQIGGSSTCDAVLDRDRQLPAGVFVPPERFLSR